MSMEISILLSHLKVMMRLFFSVQVAFDNQVGPSCDRVVDFQLKQPGFVPIQDPVVLGPEGSQVSVDRLRKLPPRSQRCVLRYVDAEWFLSKVGSIVVDV